MYEALLCDKSSSLQQANNNDNTRFAGSAKNELREVDEWEIQKFFFERKKKLLSTK